MPGVHSHTRNLVYTPNDSIYPLGYIRTFKKNEDKTSPFPGRGLARLNATPVLVLRCLIMSMSHFAIADWIVEIPPRGL